MRQRLEILRFLRSELRRLLFRAFEMFQRHCCFIVNLFWTAAQTAVDSAAAADEDQNAGDEAHCKNDLHRVSCSHAEEFNETGIGVEKIFTEKILDRNGVWGIVDFAKLSSEDLLDWKKFKKL